MEEFLNQFLSGCVGLPTAIKYLIVLLIGFLPVLEVRFAMFAGVHVLQLGLVETILCGMAGNILLILPVVVCGRELVRRLEKTRVLGWFGRWIARRTAGKMEKVRKISFWALFIFVAIPLPGTGAFTGGLVASFMDLRLRHCFFALATGVAAASVASFFLYVLPFYGGNPIVWF